MPGVNRRFLFSDADLEVLSFSGMEGISQLYQFEIDLVALSPNVAFDRLLNKSARLTIRGLDSTVREVHGVVSRFEMMGTISQRTLYRAILTPPHFKLTLRRRLRVFQDLTTQQIVTQVLQEGGISAGSLSWTLKETYKPRNYCVQYRESDMDFVARLLEEEGIAYHFQHTASELKTVFSDHPGAFQPIPGKANVVFNTTGLASGDEMVSRFSFGQQLRSGAVYLRDYSFRKPRVPVEGKAQGADPLLEVYDYPGEFVEAELGQRLATVRLQQQELDRLSGMGSTTCMRMSPGCRFTLGGPREGERYPRKELNNQEYLLTAVTHSGHQPWVLGEEGGAGTVTYSNAIAVVPSRTPFRPPRVTPRPEVLGTHAARVVGPPGEELYVDPYGRVKVRFHWEREQKNTAWVRVAADYAGAGFGNLFPPRVGQEVLVDFLEGDPDRPVVTGRVYNGEQVVPGTLPGGKTGSSIRTNSSPPTSGSDVSTGLLDGFKVNEGYNELRFEDSKESEELGIHAQKDYNVVVENNRTTLVKRDRTETVKRDQKEVVERHRTLNVKLDSLHTARTTLLQSADKLTLMVGDGSTGTSIEMTPTSMTFSATTIESSAVSINDIRGGVVSFGGQGEEQAVPPLIPGLALAALLGEVGRALTDEESEEESEEERQKGKGKSKSKSKAKGKGATSGAKYKSQDGAAKAALGSANPKSIAANKEYGGLIYRDATGKYGFTTPSAGSGTSFDPYAISVPKGTTLVGDYHTHGDYSIADAAGNPMRTSNPAKDVFDSDNFSTADLMGIGRDATKMPGYKGYLGTPSGTFKQFDPATGNISTF